MRSRTHLHAVLVAAALIAVGSSQAMAANVTDADIEEARAREMAESTGESF